MTYQGFPDSPDGKESACNAGDSSSIRGSGRSTGQGIGYLLQYSWASPGGLAGKESAHNVGNLGSIPGQGAKTLHALQPKKTKHKKQKHCCNKFH